MSESTPSGASPSTPAADVSAAAAQAPASSLPKTQDFNATVAAANSPAAIRALVGQTLPAIRDAVTKSVAESEKPAAVAPVEAAPAEDEIPAEAPAETTADAPETAPPEESEDGDDDEPEADGPVTPSKAKKLRLRLPENDTQGRLATEFLRRNRDWTYSQALEAANKQLGIKPPGVESTPAAPATPDLPQTVETVDVELDRLDTEHEKALVELRFDEASKLARSIRKLERHRLTLQEDAKQKATAQATAYEQGFAKSEAKAVELYEFANNPDSPGGKRMQEIEADLKANGDSLYTSPDKPLRIAQMVAAELNIAPKRKGAPAAKTPVAPGVPAPKKGILPSGGSSTRPVAQNQQPAVIEQVNNIKTVHELRKFMKPLIGR